MLVEELEPYGEEQLQSLLSERGLDSSGTKAALARRLAQAIIDTEGPNLLNSSAGDDAGEGSSGWSEEEQQQEGEVGVGEEGPQQQQQQQKVLSAEEREYLIADKQQEFLEQLSLEVSREELVKLLEEAGETVDPEDTTVRGVGGGGVGSKVGYWVGVGKDGWVVGCGGHRGNDGGCTWAAESKSSAYSSRKEEGEGFGKKLR